MNINEQSLSLPSMLLLFVKNDTNDMFQKKVAISSKKISAKTFCLERKKTKGYGMFGEEIDVMSDY